ncbi:hypothetical protein ABID22_000804 [Pontibacter aydingkolensis]|uniref:STAS domain-containing protein n=1 Tax=Pontibacter aydingkolensis TaxID=1911536 RepID=A0ABS7CR44_9BACT|nr:hypothetical protein [Pontibacter aydingkolensis]MBW7466327.1 hypothetical protein [Pontibacter aydingkolensis]
MHTSIQLTDIYTSEAGAVYQCDRRNRLIIDFAGELTVLKVDAFLRLKTAVESIDLVEMAGSTSRASDFEIISVCGCDKCYVLTLPQLYAFKELLAQAKFALDLNSMLHECLYTQMA